jgi:hypothetical protein
MLGYGPECSSIQKQVMKRWVRKKMKQMKRRVRKEGADEQESEEEEDSDEEKIGREEDPDVEESEEEDDAQPLKNNKKMPSPVATGAAQPKAKSK